MKIRTGFVSNSSSSSFIVRNYSPLSVEKEMLDIFMKYTILKPNEAKRFFKTWFKIFSFSDSMNRKERKSFESIWHEYTCCALEKNDLPKGRGTVVIELEGIPFYDKNSIPCVFKTYSQQLMFYEDCVKHFENSIPWKRLS